MAAWAPPLALPPQQSASRAPVLRERRQRDVEWLRQLADGSGALGRAGRDGAARRSASAENVASSAGTLIMMLIFTGLRGCQYALTLVNHLVTYLNGGPARVRPGAGQRSQGMAREIPATVERCCSEGRRELFQVAGKHIREAPRHADDGAAGARPDQAEGANV